MFLLIIYVIVVFLIDGVNSIALSRQIRRFSFRIANNYENGNPIPFHHGKSNNPLLRAFSLTSILLLASSVKRIKDENLIYNSEHTYLFSKYIMQENNVLEIGFGSGANFDYYPPKISITGLDPVKSYTSKKSLRDCERKGIQFNGVIEGVGEDLPFPSESFDSVVATLVFCSVQNPSLVLSEVSRVLKKGGYFICVEHILADESDKLLRFEQEKLDGLQQVLAGGCHLIRKTDELFLTSVPSLFSSVEESRYVNLPTQWPISRQFFAVFRK